MESIIIEIEETIALKKKQIEENQSAVNNLVFEMSDKVKTIFHLKNQIEVLDRDLHQFKKNLQSVRMPSMDKCVSRQDDPGAAMGKNVFVKNPQGL